MSNPDKHPPPVLPLTEQAQRPVQWLAGADLPAELHTGHAAIDFEHRQLLACVQRVRSICDDFGGRGNCTSCSGTSRQTCEDALVGVLGDLLAFILDHFRSEEALMRQSVALTMERAMCEAHMEDHADISGKIQELIVSLNSEKTVILLRELDVLLQRWIRNHILFHDLLLARCLDLGSKPMTAFL